MYNYYTMQFFSYKPVTSFAPRLKFCRADQANLWNGALEIGRSSLPLYQSSLNYVTLRRPN